MTFSNIIFAGTPDFAAVSLKALVDQGLPVTAVYTQPDRKAGRGQKVQPGPVKQLALGAGIDVYQPANFKSPDDVQQLADLKPDLLIVVAYGLLLPRAVLDIPTHGCINVHASLLPRWRGAAPIQRAIMAGDSETGVTIMRMEEGLDTGDMLFKAHCQIDDTDTGSSLHDKLALLGAESLLNTLKNFAEFSQKAEKQDDNAANYAKKLDKETARIDWQQTALQVYDHIRGLNSWPVAQSTLKDKAIRIWEAEMMEDESGKDPGTIVDSGTGITVQTTRGCIRITKAQLPGKKPMAAKDLLNGFPSLFSPGNKFNSPEK